MNFFTYITALIVWIALLIGSIYVCVISIKEKDKVVAILSAGLALFFMIPFFALALTLLGLKP